MGKNGAVTCHKLTMCICVVHYFWLQGGGDWLWGAPVLGFTVLVRFVHAPRWCKCLVLAGGVNQNEAHGCLVLGLPVFGRVSVAGRIYEGQLNQGIMYEDDHGGDQAVQA
jgi:hypothetical protein